MGLVREDLPRHRGPAAATRRPAVRSRRQESRPSVRGGPQGAAHPPIADGAPCERATGRGRASRAFRTSQDRCRPLLLVPALNPCLLQQLTVLLLRHPLAAFLDDRAHQAPLSSAQGRRACHHAHPRTGAGQTPEIRDRRERRPLTQSPRLPAAAQRRNGLVSHQAPVRGQTPRRLAGRWRTTAWMRPCGGAASTASAAGASRQCDRHPPPRTGRVNRPTEHIPPVLRRFRSPR